MGMLKESLGSCSSRAWKMEEKKVFKYEIAIMQVWDHLGLVPPQLVFGSRSQPPLIHTKQTTLGLLPLLHKLQGYVRISAMVLFIISITYTVLIHCCVTFYNLLCSYSYKHNYIAQGYKLCILEDVSTFLLVFVKLCLYTFLLIYIASCLLNITTKYNRVFHS